MEPYDQVVDGEIVVASDLLNESTLEAWDRRGDSSITDAKFRFVDDYIRSLAIFGGDSEIVEMRRRQRFRDIALSLYRVYNPKGLEEEKTADAVLPRFAKNSQHWVLPGGDLVIAIRFLAAHRRALHLVCAITLNDEFTAKSIDQRNIIFLEGVAIPVSPLTYDENSSGHILTHYIVKLFRDEFSGMNGLGYADGQFEVSSNVDSVMPHIHDFTRPNVIIYEPTSWFSPKRLLPHDPAWESRQHPVELMTENDYQAHRKAYYAEREPHAYEQKGDYSEFIDSMFDKYYIGYL